MKPYLVLVHGYLGGSSQWIEQVAVFSQYFHVVTVDLPGFGLNHSMESPKPLGVTPNLYLINLIEKA